MLDVTMAIASNMRALRTKLRWTQEELATQSGLSKGMISQIEQGRTNPSVKTMYRIAQAMNIPMADLLEFRGGSTIMVVSEEDAPIAWSGSGVSEMRLMLAARKPIDTEVWNCILGPNSEYKGQPHARGSRESLHVIEGRFILRIVGDDIELTSGSLALYEGDQPHEYINPDARTVARFVMMLQHS